VVSVAPTRGLRPPHNRGPTRRSGVSRNAGTEVLSAADPNYWAPMLLKCVRIISSEQTTAPYTGRLNHTKVKTFH